jgi:hypothetical protein
MAIQGFPMIRIENWDSALSAFLADTTNHMFAWGSNDCILFSANAVMAMVNEDPMGELRGAWHDEKSAIKLLASMGGLVKATSAVLGEPLPNMWFMQRGDVVQARGPGGEILMICEGDRLVGPTWQGRLMRVPMSAAEHVWAVGRNA